MFREKRCGHTGHCHKAVHKWHPCHTDRILLGRIQQSNIGGSRGCCSMGGYIRGIAREPEAENQGLPVAAAAAAEPE